MIEQTRCYISSEGLYYEGDRLNLTDAEVTRRPSVLHRWDTFIKDWVLDANAKIAADDATLIAQIATKELATLRPLRELLRQQYFTDVAPAVVTAAQAKLKQLDDDIATLRAQLK